MRIRGESVDLGFVRVSPEWRDLGYDRGFAFRVFLQVDGDWQQVAKLDAFEGDPHYHVWHFNTGREIVRPINEDSLEWCLDQLGQLPQLLTEAGHTIQSDHRGDLTSLRAKVEEVVASLAR